MVKMSFKEIEEEALVEEIEYAIDNEYIRDRILISRDCFKKTVW